MPYFEPLLGFSTGALALGDWRSGLRMNAQLNLNAVEISALRFPELAPMAIAVANADLDNLDYKSVHLPSDYEPGQELEVLHSVEQIARRAWPMVIHPDVIVDWSAWRSFGSLICIENMDKRKSVGRTVPELEPIFEQLPEASFCFDFGHAKQVDPTMGEARDLLLAFGARLQQFHFSDVDSANRHRALNQPALAAYQRVAHLCPATVPIILESQVTRTDAPDQVRLCRAFFEAKSKGGDLMGATALAAF